MVLAVYATHKNWRDEVMRPRGTSHRNQTLGFEIRLEDEKTKTRN